MESLDPFRIPKNAKIHVYWMVEKQLEGADTGLLTIIDLPSPDVVEALCFIDYMGFRCIQPVSSSACT